MAFLKTDRGFINERFIVKMFRSQYDVTGDFDVIYLDGGSLEGSSTDTAKAKNADVDELLNGPTMPC